MRTSFLMLVLFSLMETQAQILQFHEGETWQAGIHTDPGAMINDGGLFIGAEATLVMEGVYTGVSISSFDGLPAFYFDLAYHIGTSLTIANTRDFRYYLGLQLGVVWREADPNPMIGPEGGIDYYISRYFGVGIGLSYMWRSDAEFNTDDEYTFFGKLQNPDNYFRLNGTVKIFFNFDL